jgi:hypothetical protein
MVYKSTNIIMKNDNYMSCIAYISWTLMCALIFQLHKQNKRITVPLQHTSGNPSTFPHSHKTHLQKIF